ncbi:MAG: orotate phosphoribosyltransferase, partial [Deltaproteobacteria bacterium]|nr:orotate phosphoribosyltransferase [Deltaproteobacteria bacterium]
AVSALREAGCQVAGMVAIFTYNLPVSIKKFDEAGCTLITLSDYDVLIEKALATGYISEEDLAVLREFKEKF